MSKATELAAMLKYTAPVALMNEYAEAAALLREQEAKLRQYEEVMRQAREALQYLDVTAEHKVDGRVADDAIAAINKALP